MGVAGLTTFLREGRNSLATSLVLERRLCLEPEDTENAEHQRVLEPRENEIPLVIDGWGFMWGIYPENLRWATGGDYQAFSRLVERFLRALKALGCRPYFVFDGPTPAAKHDTVIQRYAGPLRSSLLFYRTSPHSRSHKSYLAHQPILPPFLLQALIDTLKANGLHDGIQIFHLPEGEADAYCVALADELEGYVVGNDSDFAILGAKPPGQAGGYKGYIPIEMMQWQLQVTETFSADSSTTTGTADAIHAEDGFQPVKSRKSKSTALKTTDRNQTTTTTTSVHLLPPTLPTLLEMADAPTACTVSLFLTIFTPAALATRLRIPAAYLPLFATILGTDHSPTMAQGRSYFFEDSMAKRDRVEIVARVIREALLPGSQPRMRKRLGVMVGPTSSTSGRNTPNGLGASLASNAGDEAFALVALVVGNMLVRPAANEEAFMELVTSMIEATCHYILPPTPSGLGLYSDETLAHAGRPNVASCCSHLPFCECSSEVAPLSDSLPDSQPMYPADKQGRVRRLYTLARNGGNLTALASFAQPDRVYSKSYLQDPEGVWLSGLDSSRKIRADAWRIFIANLYLFPVSQSDRAEVFPEGDPVEPDSAMECNVISETTEDGSDTSEDEEEFILAAKNRDSVESDDITEAKEISGIRVTEYYRVGASQTLGPHDITIYNERWGSEAAPCSVMAEPDDRHQQLLSLFGIHGNHSLTAEWQTLICILRHAIRLQQESRTSNRKPWTVAEIAKMVEASVRSSASWSLCSSLETSEPVQPTGVLLQNRNVDIVAHVTAAAIDIMTLSQALLLPEISDTKTTVYRFLEGSTWHEVLEGYSGLSKLTTEQLELKTRLVQAVIEGFDMRCILGATESSKPKRERPESPIAPAPTAKKATSKPQKTGRGRYDLLLND
ncbi:hypothetical protein NliqN6_3667 [Naganishia liquefaciens]|uniref:Asteroid domain-containing protein n=1 Tax=Naganishia liquefaciens TaxID=104408 RepID=A0A8H3YF33_9TREE|nr:hypothetical protein NliqN6_3667 [Naganishia liquefaciens]